MANPGRPKESKGGCSLITLSVPSELKQKGGLIDIVDEIAKREGSNRSEWIMRQIAEIVKVKYPSNPQATIGAFSGTEDLALTLQAKLLLKDMKLNVNAVVESRAEQKKKQSDFFLQRRESNAVYNLKKMLPKARRLSRQVYPERFKAVFEQINKLLI